MSGNVIHNIGAGVVDTDTVNKGQLDNAIGDHKQEVFSNEKHLVANPDGGNYKADDNGDVTLKVESTDANGEKHYDNVVIEDVASKEALDKLSDKVGYGQFIKDETGKGNVVDNNMTVTDAIGALDGVIKDAVDTAAKHFSVTSGNGNISVSTSTNEKGGTNYEVMICTQNPGHIN